jgi:hypothetical protein
MFHAQCAYAQLCRSCVTQRDLVQEEVCGVLQTEPKGHPWSNVRNCQLVSSDVWATIATLVEPRA